MIKIKLAKILDLEIQDHFNGIKYKPIFINKKDYMENQQEIEEQAYMDNKLILIGREE